MQGHQGIAKATTDLDDRSREILAPAGSSDPRYPRGIKRGCDKVGQPEDSRPVQVDAMVSDDQLTHATENKAAQLDIGSLKRVEDEVLSAAKAEAMNLRNTDRRSWIEAHTAQRT